MQKPLVLDASTAILLAKIDLLRDVARRAETWISESAFLESTSKNCQDARLIKALVDEGLIKKSSIDEEIGAPRRDFHLHRGEAETIALARKIGAVCATDDGPAINCCKVLGVPFMTAVVFLVVLRESGDMEEALALELLKKLEDLGRYDARIVADAEKKIRTATPGRKG